MRLGRDNFNVRSAMNAQTGTLLDVIRFRGGDQDQHEAIVIPNQGAVTYVQLRELINKVSVCLVEGGICSGDAVCIVLPNDLSFVLCWLSTTFVRAIAAPLNPDFKVEEFEFYLGDIDAKIVIVPKNGGAQAREAARRLRIEVYEMSVNLSKLEVFLESTVPPPIKRNGAVLSSIHPLPTDIALLLHTSGTTGRPKAVPLTHQNLVASLQNITRCYELTMADRTLIVMPLFHVHGLIGCLLSTLYSGGCAVIQSPKFSATHFWSHFIENRCTWYSAVPTIHQILLRCADRDYSTSGNLRFIRSCSSALAPATLMELEQRFKAPVIEAYAMTEASHQMTSNPLPPGKHKPASVGRGVGVEVAILDDKGRRVPEEATGEVCIKGPTVMHGYYRNPAATAQSFTSDGFFRTGDLGYFDKDGYLFLVGRIKELINRGGEKISPIEVDEALMEHENVAEAVCFGIPDEKYGEEIHAAVVLKRTAPQKDASQTEKEILSFCQRSMAAFKCPKKLYIVNELPRTATGKIQRRFVATHFLKQDIKQKDSIKSAKL